MNDYDLSLEFILWIRNEMIEAGLLYQGFSYNKKLGRVLKIWTDPFDMMCMGGEL